MDKKMRTRLLAVTLMMGGAMLFAQPRVSVGIGVGGYGAGYGPGYGPGYAQGPGYASVIPPCPGPDYLWVDGYWSRNTGRNIWIAGFWNRRPYAGGYNVSPRYEQPRYYNSFAGRQSFARGFERDRRIDGNRDRFRGPGQNFRQGNGNAYGRRDR
jgi:hypothetical protein